jgi:hypothetical protein
MAVHPLTINKKEVGFLNAAVETFLLCQHFLLLVAFPTTMNQLEILLM